MLMFVFCVLAVTVLYVFKSCFSNKKNTQISKGCFLEIVFGVRIICVVFHTVHFIT